VKAQEDPIEDCKNVQALGLGFLGCYSLETGMTSAGCGSCKQALSWAAANHSKSKLGWIVQRPSDDCTRDELDLEL
jgi:hypothetical protein